MVRSGRVEHDVGHVAGLVYGQLRKLAGAYLRGREGGTLQPTALVHEAYLRLARQDPGMFKDHQHFVAVAATAMRQIPTDHARRRAASKRGGDARRVTMDSGALSRVVAQAAAVDVLEIDAALTRLSELSPRQARIAELMIYAGLTTDEAAGVLGISQSLAEKEWRRGRAFVRSQLGDAA